MAELLIRAGLGDHKVLADLLAPSPIGQKRPIDRVVLHAQDAARDDKLEETARRTGTPLLVDPLTPLLQGDLDPADPWVRTVPYGDAAATPPDRLPNIFLLETLVAKVVEFQVDHGATAIIPPYFYAGRADSPAFEASITAIGMTARRMRRDAIALPLVPILSAQLQSFARRTGWQAALDRFAAAAVDVGPQAIALQLSPLGDGAESYAKLFDTLVAMRHLRSAGARVLAWRQGAYGPAFVAAGLDGYECGMGIGERSDVRSFMNSRKPRDRKGPPFAAQGIYFPALRRSVPPQVAKILLEDRKLRGRLICDSVRCCPHGAKSMLASKGRPHAVRTRSRELDELAGLPSQSWRLNHIAKQAASAYVSATKANEVLAAAKASNRIKTEGYAALEQAAEFLLTHGPSSVRDSA